MAHVTATASTRDTAPRRLVIGCGNPARADDGVGPWIARTLRERFGDQLPPDVQVLDAGTAGMEVMFAARGVEFLYIVDACRGAGAPGSVFRVPGEEVEEAPEHSYTLHDFRWNHALHGGRRMFGSEFPRRVEIFLIEAASVDFGLELSATVKNAAEEVLQQLRQELLGHTCR